MYVSVERKIDIICKRGVRLFQLLLTFLASSLIVTRNKKAKHTTKTSSSSPGSVPVARRVAEAFTDRDSYFNLSA